MTSQYRHRRTSNPVTAFPAPLEPGEIAVNTANRQLAVGDANGATIGTPLPLLAMRFFSEAAQWAAGDLTYHDGVIYRALTDTGPGAFFAASWEAISGAVLPIYLQRDGSMPMTGPLELAGDPTTDNEASNKKYVDDAISQVRALALVSDTPPPDAADNSLWWSSEAGELYIRYNDGDSTAWVIASPQPDPGTFLLKAGDTMSGPLILNANPTAAKGAATKQYVDLRLLKAGDTMTGPLVLPGDPTLPLQAATKQYVDGIDAANDALFAKAVLFDPQVLAAAQQLQARQNVYAAPLDALAYNGMQVNGAFEVSQQNGTAGVITSGGYPVDQMRVDYGGTMVLQSGQYAGMIAGYASPFNTCIAVTVTTAQASLAAANYAYMYQYIEGLRVARLRWGTPQAQPITIGFWSGHGVAGTYCGAVRNFNSTRSYVFTYTQNVANVFEYKTVTIPGDTAGTWKYDIAVGMAVAFTLASGSDYKTAAGAWAGGNYIASPDQINFVANISAIFRLSGLMVLPGSEAPSAERAPFIQRPYETELLICQRYFYRTPTPNGGWPHLLFTATAASQYIMSNLNWPVTMRQAPTPARIGTWSTTNCAAPTVDSHNVDGCRIWTQSSAAGVTQTFPQSDGGITADARM